VLQVRASYAWVAMRGLEYGGFRAMLHRKAFSVAQDFRSLEVRCGGGGVRVGGQSECGGLV
jgi:hypothetical protein